MSDKNNPASEEIEELVYQISEKLVDDQIADFKEVVKGEIEELLTLMFHPGADTSTLDLTSKERIEKIRDVLDTFRASLVEKIKEDIKIELKREILGEIELAPGIRRKGAPKGTKKKTRVKLAPPKKSKRKKRKK